MEKLNAQQIIDFISEAKKVTPVKVYVKGIGVADLSFGAESKVFGSGTATAVTVDISEGGASGGALGS